MTFKQAFGQFQQITKRNQRKTHSSYILVLIFCGWFRVQCIGKSLQEFQEFKHIKTYQVYAGINGHIQECFITLCNQWQFRDWKHLRDPCLKIFINQIILQVVFCQNSNAWKSCPASSYMKRTGQYLLADFSVKNLFYIDSLLKAALYKIYNNDKTSHYQKRSSAKFKSTSILPCLQQKCPYGGESNVYQ